MVLDRDVDSLEGGSQALSTGLVSPEEVLDRAERQRWRQEVASRVRQHRARRRKFDPNASLDLDFPAEPIAESIAPQPEQTPAPLPPLELEEPVTSVVQLSDIPSRLLRPPKVIRFPKQSADAATSSRSHREDLELADPVLQTPRILDADADAGAPAPEQMQLISTFADIRLEPASEIAAPAIELPPSPAALSQRARSAVVDGALVTTGAAIFALTFWKLAEVVPASRLVWLYALAVTTTLWLMFQYMFLVYGKGTPGMRVAGLELCNFAGRNASRFARRGRAFATALSGLSLGLGFAWSLVDEDTLGWHDRISGTYLRSGDRHSIAG